MKEIITSKGILKYRMPNIIEVYKIISESGIYKGELDDLTLRMNVIGSMKSLIDFSGVEGVKTYDELLLDIEDMLFPLSEIADSIISKTVEVLKKKNT